MQAGQESRQMKTTGHGYANGDVYISAGLRRPEAGSRRSRIGSAASMGQEYHAEPRRAQRGRPVTPLFPLGTLRRAVIRPASMADVHPPRTLRLGVPFPLSERMAAPPLLAFFAWFWETHFVGMRTTQARHQAILTLDQQDPIDGRSHSTEPAFGSVLKSTRLAPAR